MVVVRAMPTSYAERGLFYVRVSSSVWGYTTTWDKFRSCRTALQF